MNSRKTAAAKSRPHSMPTSSEVHRLEAVVHRELATHPSLSFSSLVVHRTRNGVCIDGVVETDCCDNDIRDIIGSVTQCDEVVNRLVVNRRAVV